MSTKDSLFVGKKIGQIFIVDFEDWAEESQSAFAKKIEYPVRKGAHLTEYAVLGMLLLGSWNFSDISKKRASIFSWVVGTLYAATDEIHQLFVPGRSGQLTDVMIDSLGVLMGIAVLAFLMRKYR